MGAPETALSRVAGILSVTRLDLRSDLDRMEDAEDLRSFLRDLCKSLPSIFWRSTAIRRTGCNCHPDTVLWTSRRLASSHGRAGDSRRSAVLLMRMAVGPDCACVLERYALVCRDVDGEIESMADDALSNLRAVESQMESDEADIAIANYWERRAMR